MAPMLLRLVPAAALAAMLVALLSACAGSQRALTLEEFYGFCWPAQIDTNCGDDSLCQDFKDYLAQEHASKEECIKGCGELQTAKWREDAIRGCEVSINNATDWCEKYCRNYFDYGPPSQQGQAAPAQ
ncbi:hypothetical protein [Fundidesulfovibrio terrae]|uniref:hypothetical protein n=1 Tax=Fundidesulfovibrio terrae TaxID=2922866 RepID=UPI001FAEB10C|nr:hypothetical protein [Fundidesulfovibrio terrae]